MAGYPKILDKLYFNVRNRVYTITLSMANISLGRLAAQERV